MQQAWDSCSPSGDAARARPGGGGNPSLAEHSYVVEARVPAREFLLRKRIARSIVEQDLREAVELLVQLLNTRLAPELQSVPR
jgi:hypothetical protein